MKFEEKDISFASLVLRGSVGLTFFFAGINKILNFSERTSGIVGAFKETWLPEFLVSVFAYPLPFIEFVLGLLAIIGLFTRPVFYILGILMLTLNFGLLVQGNYETAARNLPYFILIAANLILLKYNRFSLDGMFWGRKEKVA